MNPLPPPILRRLLIWVLPPGRVRDGLLGDLDELYAEQVRDGHTVPKLWYVRQLLSAAVHYPPRRLWLRVTRREGATMIETIDEIRQDVRYSLRRVARSPGFAAIVILTLALGIGANTAIFSFVDALLLRPLPYDEPQRLVTIFEFSPSLNLDAPVSAPGFRDYREQLRTFERMGITAQWAPNLTGIGEPERLVAGRVSAGYFETFGVPPALGRLFLDEEDSLGRNRAVILSDGFWKRALGGDPSVIERSIQLNGESHQVVGVMPPGFRDQFGRDRELWVPLGLGPEEFADANRTSQWLMLVARLRPGVSVQTASRELTQFSELLKQRYPHTYAEDWTLRIMRLADLAKVGVRPALFVLMGAVGFVLLIACANVANLLLAKSAGRLKDIAVRSALGAKRWQIIRQLLSESLVLAIGGGAVGVVLAYWSVRGLVAASPIDLTGIPVGIDVKVLAFTAALAIATGLLFGIAPALHGSGTNVQDTLREGGRGAQADRKGHRLRKVLVVVELALALSLLAGAGLLIQSFARLQRVSPGFDPDNLLTFSISLPVAKYATDTTRLQFFDRLLPRLEALPGVRAAGMTSVLPFGGGWSTGGFSVEGYQPPEGQPEPWGDRRGVSPGFASAMRLPLLRGRFFDERDRAGSEQVVVVDEEMVRRYWPNTDPIGKRITEGNPESPDITWATVIGVVAHAAHEGLDAEARVQRYYPHAQLGWANMQLVVRTAGRPTDIVPAVRQAVYSVDPDQPIADIRAMDERIAEAVGQRRLTMTLLGAFAGIALLLASLGIYGVMSHLVAQRTQELGVRMALGAQALDLLTLVLREGMALVAVGTVIGIVGSVGLTQFIQNQLFGVQATDPVTFAVVAGVLVLTAFAATCLPAYRAARLDPVTALRRE